MFWTTRFMRSSFIRRVRMLGSVIGIFAILMTAFAPTISQALVMRETPANDALVWRCSTGHAGSKALQHQDEFSACGYCNFVAHHPGALPSATIHAVVIVLRPARYRGHFHTIAPFAPVVAAQPRAPPSFIG